MSDQHFNTIWEYKTVNFDTKGSWARVDFNKLKFDTMLEENGQDGWELVSTTSLHEVQGRTSELIVVFKRPVRS
jgi:hypothetical protein